MKDRTKALLLGVILCNAILMFAALGGGADDAAAQKIARLEKRLHHFQPAALLVPELREAANQVPELRQAAARARQARVASVNIESVQGYAPLGDKFLIQGNDILKDENPESLSEAKALCDKHEECVAFCFEQTEMGMGAVYFKSSGDVTDGAGWVTYVHTARVHRR
eukprot:TRINITY_DN28356_c0_g1_i1.p1 TRINITY_DN28356_c0_g1~~TRINITY_DN28356_c0_g1_i1.p1  ORF type:complete len:167 (+),score=52.00 TRINITY_DN28356_c0_g1_i1:1-501(+)